MQIHTTHVLTTILLLVLASASQGQVFSLDYLTLADAAAIFESRIYRDLYATWYLGRGEFDENGDYHGLQSRKFSEMNIFFRYAFNFDQKFQMNIAGRFGSILASNAFDLSYGDVWLWGKVRPFISVPLTLRAGLKAGEIGHKIRSKQNDIDIGLLATYPSSGVGVETSLSYRIRFERPRNEIHYKVDIGIPLSSKATFSILTLGYFGYNDRRSLDVIPDSHSRKLTSGAGLKVKLGKQRLHILLLADVAGMRDKAGVTLVFAVHE